MKSRSLSCAHHLSSEEILFDFNDAFVLLRFNRDSIVDCKKKSFSSPSVCCHHVTFRHQGLEVQGIAEFPSNDFGFKSVAHREVETIDVLSHYLHVACKGTEGDEGWKSFAVRQVRGVKAKSNNTRTWNSKKDNFNKFYIQIP